MRIRSNPARPIRLSARASAAPPTRRSLPRWAYLLLALGLGAMSYHLLTAPEVAIAEVHITGNRLVPAEEIAAAAGLKGKNLFLAAVQDTAAAVQRIRRLEAASVQLYFPPAAEVRVKERTPKFVWQVEERRFLVDAEGVVLAAAGSDDRLPVIRDRDQKAVAVESQVDRQAVVMAAGLLALLRTELPGVQPSFEYSQREGLVLVSTQGWRALFGTGGSVPRQVAALKAILGQMAQEKKNPPGQVIDLRFGDQAYIK